MMLEAEGVDRRLVHEAAAARSRARADLRLRPAQEAAAGRRVFGNASQEYDDTYRFRPYSKSFVRHLDYYYAQYHPDEDFVETFAVWLTPGLDWREEYAGWKALDKLLFVDELMKSIADQPPLKECGKPQLWQASQHPQLAAALLPATARRRSREPAGVPRRKPAAHVHRRPGTGRERGWRWPSYSAHASQDAAGHGGGLDAASGASWSTRCSRPSTSAARRCGWSPKTPRRWRCSSLAPT